MQQDPEFQSFFMGGFECSSHRRPNGQRLDLIAATHHDQHVLADYQTLQTHGIATVRDGFRWHLIEQTPGQFDFSSARPLVHAAQVTGVQVIWDLCHYGWPDDLDVWGPQFVPRYAAFARAAAAFIKQELDVVPYYVPINEISFLAWAGGDAGFLNPHAHGRSFELKVQLVRAAIAGIEAIWSVDARARIIHADPMIHVAADRYRPQEQHEAEIHRQNQFQAWDMLCGDLWPQLGGHPKYLDILGVNYYSNNQWINGGGPIDRFHPQYRWFSHMLGELYTRYGRTLIVAETGCEGEARAEWLAYIGREVRLALDAGVPVRGICLYPILDYPGWDDERHCRTGLLSYAVESGHRTSDARLSAMLAAQQAQFAAREAVHVRHHTSLTAQPHVTSKLPRSETPALCLYTESTLPSGMGETMLALAAGLQNQFRISLVCPAEDDGAYLLQQAEALGMHTFSLPLHQSGPSAEVLHHWLRANPIDIFHCHAGIGWEGLRGTTVAHGVGVRAIVRTEHLPYMLNDPQQQEDYHQSVAVVDRLVCVSEGVRASLREAGVAESILRVVHRAGTRKSPKSDRATMRARLGFAPHTQMVLTVGRLTEQKGYPTLLAAIAQLAEQDDVPHARFVWAGVGPLESRLRAAVRAAGLQERIMLIGHSDDVAGLLGAADLFVLPSQFEGLPLALVEAVAAGLPVVATRVGGIPEVLRAFSPSHLVEPDHPRMLADAVRKMLTAAPRRVEGAVGGERVTQQFGVGRMVAAMLEVYREVLGQGQVRRGERGFAVAPSQLRPHATQIVREADAGSA